MMKCLSSSKLPTQNFLLQNYFIHHLKKTNLYTSKSKKVGCIKNI
ncbi:12146_t:CDS:2 [Racocetra persica]|uniref:12146_t:CDS:1 n=1 Tax=Racocetra persica TaxID=160502 RepID=A0ACA9KCC2_9GLOM|nr:12146_t:CDS:2 [Racocetra persica]